MIEVPREITTLAEIERHIQWCEIEGNLHSLTPLKCTIGPGEEIPVVPSINSYQAGSSWEEIVNSRLSRWGKSLPKPGEVEKHDVSYFSFYVDFVFLEAKDHQAIFYEEWKLAEQHAIESLEHPEKHTGFYSEWIQELHQRYENSLKKYFTTS